MGVENLPEIKLAKKLFKLHSLKIPFNLDELVQEYATVYYKRIPIEGVDGVSLNLKVPGKKPVVIVNSDISSKRQRFTLAHELGHVIIPWHIGTIVDNIYSENFKNYHYVLLEQEANRFAAELLMPTEWIVGNFENLKGNLADLQKEIVIRADVSDHAAAIKMTEVLPKDIVYCAVENGLVSHTGSTTSTNAFLQSKSSVYDKNFYSYFDDCFLYSSGRINYYWWKLSSSVNLRTEDKREWREILDKIIIDINPEDAKKFKSSINGIIAYINGRERMEEGYSIDSVVIASIYRLKREGMNSLVSHKDFETFVIKRVHSLFNQ